MKLYLKIHEKAGDQKIYLKYLLAHMIERVCFTLSTVLNLVWYLQNSEWMGSPWST